MNAFDLPDRLSPKADPALIAGLSDRLDTERKAPAGKGQRALDRNQEIRR